MSVVIRTRPSRLAPPPPSRPASAPARRPTVDEVVAADRPEEPVHCLRPATVTATARRVHRGVSRRRPVCREVQSRPGRAACAVRPAASGISTAPRSQEIRLVRDMFPDADIHFMHPVKSRGAIREAWAQHGVRDFVLDTQQELDKILTEIAATGVAGALGSDRAHRAAQGRGAARSVRQVRRRCDGGRCVCCVPRVRPRLGWASASMSARSASIRWPGVMRWT